MDNYLLRIHDIVNTKIFLLAKNPNIIGMGLGNKIINGKTTNLPSLTFFVNKKLSINNLNAENIIPPKLFGVYTDIIETNQNNPSIYKIPQPNYVRPATGGLLIGTDKNNYGGTLGYPVIDKNNTVYILSGPGVMSSDFTGKRGTAIYQPARSQGYIPDLDKLATFEKALPVKVLDDPLDTSPEILNSTVGEIASVGQLSTYLLKKFITPQLSDGTIVTKVKESEVQQNQNVKFIGANSGPVIGKIVVKPLTLRTRITHKNIFNKQIAITNAVQFQCANNVELTPYDVGALVVDAAEPHKAVGLMVAGLGTAGVFCPIKKILDSLGVSLLVNKP